MTTRTTRPSNRAHPTRSYGHAVLSGAALLAILTGPPAALALLVGNPWPDSGVDLGAPITDTMLIGLLAAVCWIAWAQIAACILVETIATLRRAPLPGRLPGTFAIQQHLARQLITAVLAAGTTTLVVAPVTPATATAPAAASSAPAQLDPPHAANQPQTVDQAASTPDVTVTVERGDTLWSLAIRHLGDGTRHRDITTANTGRTMADGTAFHPDRPLPPGSTLALPADATNLPDTGTPSASEDDPQAESVIVEPGDTLWDIADTELDNPERWTEIYDTNQGTRFDDGRTLNDPDLIHPGWTLDLPTTKSTAPSATPPAAPPAEAPAEVLEAPTWDRPPGDPADHATETPAEESASEVGQAPDQRATDTPALEDTEPAQESGDATPAWVVPGLVAGGALISGGLALALHRRRLAQQRWRRPGRVMPTPDLDTSVEKTIGLQSVDVEPDLDLVDSTLHRLAAHLSATGHPAPQFAAVELTPTTIAIHLRAPAVLPAPFQPADDEQVVWVLGRDADLTTLPAPEPDAPAPWPLLVTIGADDRGHTWLLSLEGQHLAIHGDTDTAEDMLRYVAAEISCNPWSTDTDLYGDNTISTLTDLNRERLTLTDPAEAAAEVLTTAVGTIDRLAGHTSEVDATTARIHQIGHDTWPAALAATTHADVHEVTELSRLLDTHGTRSGATLLTATAEIPSTAVNPVAVHIDADRRIQIDAYQLTLNGVGLTETEADGCAALLAQADDLVDITPPDLDSDAAWSAYATTTGALRATHVIPRDIPTTTPADSLLPDDDDHYTDFAYTTEEDLEALAPQVIDQVATEVIASDPDLDRDLAEWWSDTTTRPRLTLLGPVTARAHGQPLHRRKAYYVELLTYMATRPHGATAAQVADAFTLTSGRMRADVGTVRRWLGTDPTGAPYLPDARANTDIATGGIPAYRPDVLIDADLFRRLRLRGQAHGSDGIGDLVAALRLVTGRPYTQLRTGGWSWMLDDDRTDHHLTAAIADVAHIVVTHALAGGDTRQARFAIDAALRGAPDEEIVRLDHAAVLRAEGAEEEAAAVLDDGVCNRSDDGGAPLDLGPRTESLLRQQSAAGRSRIG